MLQLISISMLKENLYKLFLNGFPSIHYNAIIIAINSAEKTVQSSSINLAVYFSDLAGWLLKKTEIFITMK